MENNVNKIEVGDKIQVQGITVEVASIAFQEHYSDGFITEFTDTRGNYRSWKQCVEGGKLIKKHS